MKWKRLLVVTSDYHVKRTVEIFRFVYGGQYSIEVKGADTERDSNKMENEKKSLSMFYETFKGIEPGSDALIYQRLYKNHPFYGVVYPRILTEVEATR